MKNILNYIPGFRSRQIWKMIIAGIYYLIAVITISQGFSFFLMMLCWPFLTFYFIDFVKQFKNFKKANEGMNEERKRFNSSGIKFITTVIILIVSISTMGGNKNNTVATNSNQPTSTASAPSVDAKQTPTPEPKKDFKDLDLTKENIQAAIEKAVGKDKLIKIETEQDKGLNIVNIYFNPGEVWNEKALVSQSATTACDVMQILFTNPKVDKIWFWTQTKMTDAKGNSSDENVMNVCLTKENAKDINWSTFKTMVGADYNKLLNIADSSYIHPGIKKNLK